jgi:hypothetical protein
MTETQALWVVALVIALALAAAGLLSSHELPGLTLPGIDGGGDATTPERGPGRP